MFEENPVIFDWMHMLIRLSAFNLESPMPLIPWFLRTVESPSLCCRVSVIKFSWDPESSTARHSMLSPLTSRIQNGGKSKLAVANKTHLALLAVAAKLVAMIGVSASSVLVAANEHSSSCKRLLWGFSHLVHAKLDVHLASIWSHLWHLEQILLLLTNFHLVGLSHS